MFGGPFSKQRLVIEPTRREYYGIPERGYKKVKCNKRKFEFPPCSDIIAVHLEQKPTSGWETCGSSIPSPDGYTSGDLNPMGGFN